ncbi:helix-turn-helix domain-containing protein [Leisingera caerulea]|uniref:helix-turn-helix domain-containing protein n=1 Tax=Leisingera caerulea TaxID=506591 RepID=UPI0021A3F079|nr:helix-turn-helix transcriptional regulator [Leisingera caerulea]
MDDELSAAECRQARQGLDWTRDKLAEAANVGKRTIIDFENGVRQPVSTTRRALKAALEGAGVKFGNDEIVVPVNSNRGAE